MNRGGLRRRQRRAQRTSLGIPLVETPVEDGDAIVSQPL
jgi:hypothetical protein